MAEFNETVTHEEIVTEAPKRTLIWSGIVAGTVAALGVQLILTLIGMGVAGLNTNPATAPGQAPHAIGIGAALWLVISGLISFGFGGYVAGYVSSYYRTTSGSIHGMLAWALAAVLGATVTAFAGSTALGGAAAGLGAAARDTRIQTTDSRWSSATPTPTVSRDSFDTPRTLDTGRPATITEAEARANAERAAAGKTAMWTGFAFLLSMIAAAVGGKIGRGDHPRVLREVHVRHNRNVARV
jgi:hypothetical protein